MMLNRWVCLTEDQAYDEVVEAIGKHRATYDAHWDYNVSNIVHEAYDEVGRDMFTPTATVTEFWQIVDRNNNTPEE